MRIWPAIDLRGGCCVRLEQGDYGRETVFGDDPAGMAQHWVAEGGDCLHLVDLDGARSGQVENWQAIEAILRAVQVPCELGGGIRNETTIERAIALGIDRLVIGSRAVKEPDWFRQVCRKYPGRLALGLDARRGMVATDGWLSDSRVTAIDLARSFAREPLAAIIYTDIETDGMLSGPNLEAIGELANAVDLPIVASGGVANADDVGRLAQLGVAGCIIGRALYQKTLSLAEALRRAGGQPKTD